MPPMNLDLTKAQCGLETTAGTPVAATRLVPFVTGSYTPRSTSRRSRKCAA